MCYTHICEYARFIHVPEIAHYTRPSLLVLHIFFRREAQAFVAYKAITLLTFQRQYAVVSKRTHFYRHLNLVGWSTHAPLGRVDVVLIPGVFLF